MAGFRPESVPIKIIVVSLVCLVHLVCLVYLVYLVCLVGLVGLRVLRLKACHGTSLFFGKRSKAITAWFHDTECLSQDVLRMFPQQPEQLLVHSIHLPRSPTKQDAP